MTSLVADRALYRAANLAKLAQTQRKWITRVPATLREAQAALAQAEPPTMVAFQAGYRAHEWTAPDGGVAQRWVLSSSEPRRVQAQRPVDKQWRQQSDQDGKAWKKGCGVIVACEADARQARATFAQNLPSTGLASSTGRATPR